MPCNYFVCFLAQVGSGNLFGDDLLTGGPSGILQPMNKAQTEVQQTQNSVNKGDLDTSLNKVVQSIGEYYQGYMFDSSWDVESPLNCFSFKTSHFAVFSIWYRQLLTVNSFSFFEIYFSSFSEKKLNILNQKIKLGNSLDIRGINGDLIYILLLLVHNLSFRYLFSHNLSFRYLASYLGI